MQTTKKLPQVVIVGGGFAGIEVIKTLQKNKAKVDITLVSKKSTFEYYPALYKLVTGTWPMEASVPLKTIYRQNEIKIIEATYTGLDQSRQVITLENGLELAYDYLVLALGSETNYFNIKGLPELSFSFKSVSEALKLKQHFCEIFGNASTHTKEELVSLYHVLIVGAGPSGVELAGDLRHYLTTVATEFKVDPNLITIDLIEAGPRVLPTMSEKVSQKAEARLRKMGINIFVNRSLQSQEIEEVVMKDMQMESHTVIWTAGTRLNPGFMSIENVQVDEKKRVVVSPNLNLPNDNHIFIAGDGAATPYSGLAQTAIEHGKYIGNYIDNIVECKTSSPYKPARPSYVIPIGNFWAVFINGNFVMTGFIPWLLRSLIDLKYFLSILPLRYVFEILEKGKKYRKFHGGCSINEKDN